MESTESKSLSDSPDWWKQDIDISFPWEIGGFIFSDSDIWEVVQNHIWDYRFWSQLPTLKQALSFTCCVATGKLLTISEP